jgi:hypothetical protein
MAGRSSLLQTDPKDTAAHWKWLVKIGKWTHFLGLRVSFHFSDSSAGCIPVTKSWHAGRVFFFYMPGYINIFNMLFGILVIEFDF